MTTRFRPPSVTGLQAVRDEDRLRALTEARQAAYAEGQAKGRAEGRAEGLAEGNAATTAALGPELAELRENIAKRDRRVGVAEALRAVLAARETDLEALQRATGDVVAQALRTLFPVLLATSAGGEIVALLSTALTEREPEALVLRGHPDTLAMFAAETTTPRDGSRVRMQPAPDMAPGEAEIGWTGGGIRFDPAALMARVADVLAPSAPALHAAAIDEAAARNDPSYTAETVQ
jgi:flagellar biosynthesis/type III secretory pathway protein FliH